MSCIPPLPKSHRLASRLVGWLCALGLVGVAAAPCSAAIAADWEHAPYGLQLILAVDAPGQLDTRLRKELLEHLRRRVDVAIGPVWSLDMRLASPAVAHRMLNDLQSVPLTDLAADPAAVDKLLLVTVRHDGRQFDLAAREYDGYTQRWGSVVTDDCRQYAAVPERVFQLVWNTFAPQARFQLIPDVDDRVRLDLRASAMALKDPSAEWFEPGEIFLPVLRRTTHDGEIIPNGIQTVPWTFLEAIPTDEEGPQASVQSGNRRPFGVRRRGRIEQVAVALRGAPAPVELHLVARTDKQQPLAGYEIYSRDTDVEALTYLGLSNRRGTIVVPPGKTPVQTLFIRNGRQLMAKLPVVPGAVAEIEVPLPDDEPRLRAEARLNALRESLVDLVARRNILLARTRQLIGQGDYTGAAKLLDTLDGLPGRAQMNRLLNQQEQLYHSDDPQIQYRIERLFTETRQVLGEFLDVREINSLRDELNAARSARGTSEPSTLNR